MNRFQPTLRFDTTYDFYEQRRTFYEQRRMNLQIAGTLLVLGNAALWTAALRQRSRNRWRARRFGAGSCQHCGYNLTGVTSMRCPECGTAYPGRST